MLLVFFSYMMTAKSVNEGKNRVKDSSKVGKILHSGKLQVDKRRILRPEKAKSKQAVSAVKDKQPPVEQRSQVSKKTKNTSAIDSLFAKVAKGPAAAAHILEVSTYNVHKVYYTPSLSRVAYIDIN